MYQSQINLFIFQQFFVLMFRYNYRTDLHCGDKCLGSLCRRQIGGYHFIISPGCRPGSATPRSEMIRAEDICYAHLLNYPLSWMTNTNLNETINDQHRVHGGFAIVVGARAVQWVADQLGCGRRTVGTAPVEGAFAFAPIRCEGQLRKNG